MATDEEHRENQPGNLLDELLAEVREQYVEEHGEEPSEEFLEEARTEILLTLARRERDKHRDVYDALADE